MISTSISYQNDFFAQEGVVNQPIHSASKIFHQIVQPNIEVPTPNHSKRLTLSHEGKHNKDHFSTAIAEESSKEQMDDLALDMPQHHCAAAPISVDALGENGTCRFNWRDFAPITALVVTATLAENIFAELAVQRCDEHLDLYDSSEGYPITDNVLILSDIHVDSLCPFADPWMTAVRRAAERVHKTSYVIVLGDIMSWGGGSSGDYNISDTLFGFHVRRLLAITGCDDSVKFGRCVIIPGNHDLVDVPTERWLRHFPAPNQGGVLGSGLSFYALNGQAPVVPFGTQADLLISHEPVQAIGNDSLNYSTPTILTNGSFKAILSGHLHVSSNEAIGNPPEVIVPSFNPMRALLSKSEGCLGLSECRQGMGFGILRRHVNGALSYQRCMPWERAGMWAGYALLGLLVLCWAKSHGNMRTTFILGLAGCGAAYLALYLPLI